MTTAAGLDRPASHRTRHDRRRSSAAGAPGARRLPAWLCVLVVVAPFAVAAVRFNLSGGLILGGTQSLIALDVLDASRLDQLVGPWSGAGWAHPGPVWLYLLAGLWTVLGSEAASMVAAALLVHAGFAALLVVAVGRTRPWAQPVMALVVLVYVLRMPAEVFVGIGNAYAVLLPAALAVVLAARAANGSVAALGGLLAVGSFLVQTHARTVWFVLLVGLVAVVGLVVALRRPTSAGAGRRGLLLGAGGLVLTAVMWLPPLYQQLRPGAGGGNLAQVARDLLGTTSPEPWLSSRAALSGAGQMLGAPVYGWPATGGPLDTGSLSLGVLLALAGQVAGAAALVWLARRRGESFVAALGVVVLAGTAAAVLTARTVPRLDSAAVLWATVLPAVLLFGWVALVAGGPRQETARTPGWARPAVVVALVVASVLATISVMRGTAELADEAGVAQAFGLVRDGVPVAGDDEPPVVLDIGDDHLWQTAAGLALLMEQDGRPVAVGEPWVPLFGTGRAVGGSEVWRITLVAAADVAQVPFGAAIGVVPARDGDAALVLSRVGV